MNYYFTKKRQGVGNNAAASVTIEREKKSSSKLRVFLQLPHSHNLITARPNSEDQGKNRKIRRKFPRWGLGSAK